MNPTLIEQFKRQQQIAVLIDPEKCQSKSQLMDLIERINIAEVHYIFIGGSTVSQSEFDFTISLLREHALAPIIIFPGSSDQISEKADGILFLSLISGRNPDFLIGHHVQSAQRIVDSGIEVIPTAYLLIDGGTQSSVAYVSQTTPIPRDKVSIVKNTALAGKLQGKQVVFLDAGSGAKYSVTSEIVKAVSELNLPLIIGGGITSLQEINELHSNGANIVVIGNKIESDVDFLLDLKNYVRKLKNEHH